MIKKENRAELIGQVIDIFEDFLDEKGVIIPNNDRDKDPDYDPENPVNFYGNDYDTVKEKLEQLFRSWKVLEDERPLIDYQFKVSINGITKIKSIFQRAFGLSFFFAFLLKYILETNLNIPRKGEKNKYGLDSKILLEEL